MPTPSKREPIIKTKLLLGEGQDEVFFFEALLKYLNINDIQVEQYRGKYNFKTFLEALRERDRFDTLVSIGITRDADNSVDDAFRSICDSLKNSGFSVPSQPSLLVGNTPAVGVFLLPDNRNPGMLEDLCLKAFETEPIFQCIDDYFRCVGITPRSLAKARMHAWLSAQDEPDRRLGEAAKAGYLPWDSMIFEELRQFLQMF